MIQIAILTAVIVIGLYFIFRQHFQQKLREEKFEFTKKMHEKDQEVQMYKTVSTITPEKAQVLIGKIKHLEKENERLTEVYSDTKRTLEKNQAENKKAKSILQAIEKEKKKITRKSPKSNNSSDSRISSNDHSSSTIEQLAILALLSDRSNNDSSSNSDWSGNGGESSGGGSSDSYDSGSSYDSSSSSDSSSSYDSSSSSDSGSSDSGSSSSD